jgi:predicted RND superfamily exporter protein
MLLPLRSAKQEDAMMGRERKDSERRGARRRTKVNTGRQKPLVATDAVGFVSLVHKSSPVFFICSFSDKSFTLFGLGCFPAPCLFSIPFVLFLRGSRKEGTASKRLFAHVLSSPFSSPPCFGPHNGRQKEYALCNSRKTMKVHASPVLLFASLIILFFCLCCQRLSVVLQSRLI